MELETYRNRNTPTDTETDVQKHTDKKQEGGLQLTSNIKQVRRIQIVSAHAGSNLR